MSNIPVEEIYNKDFNFKYNLKPDIWDRLIAPSKSTYKEELKSKYVVEALKWATNPVPLAHSMCIITYWQGR
jgi:hypothetical protein